LPGNFVGGEFDSELIVGETYGAAEGSAIVGDPVGTGGEELRISAGGTDGENTGTRGFAGARAGSGVFDDNAIDGREAQGFGAFEIGFGMRLAVADVAGSDKVLNKVPDTGSAEADFGEVARGGGDDDALRGGDSGEELTGAGKSDDIGNVFEFAAKHPEIFFIVDFGAFAGEKILDGGSAGAAVGEGGDVDRVHIVARGPAGPDASDGGGGIDEDAVHVNQQATANDAGHKRKIVA
jgi:hypothetical protein